VKTVGVVAHVDAGKTTLSEAILYHCGALRTLGRVDHRDTLLDHDPAEKRRGITIYADQAEFSHDGQEYALVDTPGHADFAPEMERALSVLDVAVLVISVPSGIQAHTRTLWRLLRKGNIPTVLFLNKCDAPGAAPKAVMEEISSRFFTSVCDLTQGITEDVREQMALLDDALLEKYLSGEATDEELLSCACDAMKQGTFCPCICGSALHGEGVEELLQTLDAFTETHYDAGGEFSALCHAVRHDAKGNRVAFLKVLSGVLRPRQTVGEEKVAELRRYAGEKFSSLSQAEAGMLCAVTGLREIRAGEMLGCGACPLTADLQPLLRAKVCHDASVPAQKVLEIFRILEAEEPTLSVTWSEQVKEIHLCLMGEIQTEILAEAVSRRFGIDVTFSPPEILYRETVAKPVVGSGHYEPLRHYAEVRLLLSPGERGSGITFDSLCPTDELLLNWQRLIAGHVSEKKHVGVLTGSPLTDVKITLLAGRAHLKHTEGGDFRQATYRAIRHGLFYAQNVLLEPYYRFTFRVELPLAGRILTDLQAMSCLPDAPESDGETSVICGRGPVSELLSYSRGFAALTRGKGELTLDFDGYEPCHNTEEVVARLGYDRETDAENPAGSVFCDHGAGFHVPWDEAEAMMHCDIRDVLKGVKL